MRCGPNIYIGVNWRHKVKVRRVLIFVMLQWPGIKLLKRIPNFKSFNFEIPHLYV